MLRFVVNRLLQGLIVLLALYTITFFLIKGMPGDPFTGEKNISEEVKANMKKKYGLDKDVFTQYVLYLKAVVLQGDLGISTSKARSVNQMIAQSFPASLILGLTALGIAICIGIPLGVVSAVKKNTWVDYSGMAVAMIGICVPAFTIGPLLQIWLALKTPFFNVAGWGSPRDIILPAVTLGLVSGAYLARLTRGGMLEILSQDYIRTAHAKGVPLPTVIWRHALRGGLLPAVAYIGPAFAALISGSFIVETIFQVPGMGQHFVNATKARDPFLLQGVVLFFGLLIVIMNLAADIVTGMLNPRVRLGNE
ncbi:MAG: oligopeptide transport system permease protein [Verrucomicrobiales bacterium]|jgi:oligopeptide transport system permease protein